MVRTSYSSVVRSLCCPRVPNYSSGPLFTLLPRHWVYLGFRVYRSVSRLSVRFFVVRSLVSQLFLRVRNNGRNLFLQNPLRKVSRSFQRHFGSDRREGSRGERLRGQQKESRVVNVFEQDRGSVPRKRETVAGEGAEKDYVDLNRRTEEKNKGKTKWVRGIKTRCFPSGP